MSLANLVNITIDDFDPVVVYSNPGDWSTPNPQDHPSWYNASRELTGSIWHQSTYHQTNVEGAVAGLNFTGSALYVWGASGPSYGNYSITIDDVYEYRHTAYAAENATERHLLFGTDQLVYGPHEITVGNTGPGNLLLDMFVVGVELGDAGATLTNTTVDEHDASIAYSGTWTTNNDTLFYGGSSIYTSTPGDSFSFNFSGSGVYIFGDQVNDHGYYSVYLNDSQTPSATLTGRSGCGGRTDKFCEKLHGLHFVANDLPQGTHSLKLVNGGTSDNRTFFDLDYIVYTTPSAYSNRTLVTNATFPFINSSSTPTASSPAPDGSAAGSPVPSTTSKASLAMNGWPFVITLVPILLASLLTL